MSASDSTVAFIAQHPSFEEKSDVRVGMFPMDVAERLERQTRPLIDRLMDDQPLEPSIPGVDLRGYVELALQGGFPAILSLSDQGRRRWLDSYDQLLTRDAALASGAATPLGSGATSRRMRSTRPGEVVPASVEFEVAVPRLRPADW